jgi:hypothetical protein
MMYIIPCSNIDINRKPNLDVLCVLFLSAFLYCQVARKVKTKDYEKDHREVSDAMEKAINWLATQPVGTEVTVTEITMIKRTA